MLFKIDIAKQIKKHLSKDEKIKSFIESMETLIYANPKFRVLSINLLLKNDCFCIKKITDVIREVLSISVLRKFNANEIKIIEITFSYKLEGKNKRILRFAIDIDSIFTCSELTPEQLRTIKPLYDLKDSDGLHCGWYFLKRFPDESDTAWKNFQTHPHFRTGDNIPDFVEI